MASWVTPSVQAVGDILTAAIWNQNVVDNTTFLYQRPYIKAFASVTTGFSGTAQIGLQTVAFSGYGFTLVSNQLVVPVAGIYQVDYQLNIPVATSLELFVHAFQNGVDEARATSHLTINPGTGSAGGSTLLSCAVSDVIDLRAGNTSGSVNCDTGVNLTYLSAVFVGPI